MSSTHTALRRGSQKAASTPQTDISIVWIDGRWQNRMIMTLAVSTSTGCVPSFTVIRCRCIVGLYSQQNVGRLIHCCLKTKPTKSASNRRREDRRLRIDAHLERIVPKLTYHRQLLGRRIICRPTEYRLYSGPALFAKLLRGPQTTQDCDRTNPSRARPA